MNTARYASGSGCVAINVRVPDLRYIEYVLDVECSMTPFDCTTGYLWSNPVNKKVSGNIVGMTIDLANSYGATLTVTVLAIGPP